MSELVFIQNLEDRILKIEDKSDTSVSRKWVYFDNGHILSIIKGIETFRSMLNLYEVCVIDGVDYKYCGLKLGILPNDNGQGFLHESQVKIIAERLAELPKNPKLQKTSTKLENNEIEN
ncbi:hypothetical protein LEP1GSC047_3768 [Leptospira inadai serovar Lyme str. 10]|uniref:Uncharacterized protein n=2 Tax=Leptospira inadai serovar Lyme TaxID=293084 RepID=V6HL32_9LEPT|nr:hypothetical protein [Leptospira inadai]EQA37610.1 hypothetical protein LEP1GSC047_3768 [Leptospira inadai serovar Lyme str. 10]PNV76515.1 hypothetical protein BES34_002690 [Leptospira inadai serovar Lyme]